MRAIDFKPYVKNTLRGFFTIELHGGLQIRDCTLHTANGKSWFGFPGIPYKDKTDKTQYKSVIFISDRSLLDKVQAAVCEQLKKHTANQGKESEAADGIPF